MKKLLTALMFLVGIHFSTQAQYCGNSGSFQCTPSGTLTQPGLMPLSDSLPPLVNGASSTTVIQFKNFDTIRFGGQLLTVQTFRFDSIGNLPSGLCWATNDANNTFLNQQAGCIKINGTTCAPPGQYRLRIIMTVCLGPTLGGCLPIQADAAAAGLFYYLRVKNNGDADIAVDTTGQSGGATPDFIAYGGAASCNNLCSGFHIDSVNTTNVSCTAGNDGAACVYASGGTGAYVFSWTPAVSVSSCGSNLAIGNYNVMITDSNNCTISASSVVSQDTGIVNVTIAPHSQLSCTVTSIVLNALVARNRNKLQHLR